MEARAAKCAFTLHSPALQNPQTGWITLTRTNFGSVCLCQHGPPATAHCCSQSCIKWENPVSSRAKESLTLLNRITSYVTEQEIRLIWHGGRKCQNQQKSFILLLYMATHEAFFPTYNSERLCDSPIHMTPILPWFLLTNYLVVFHHLTCWKPSDHHFEEVANSVWDFLLPWQSFWSDTRL